MEVYVWLRILFRSQDNLLISYSYAPPLQNIVVVVTEKVGKIIPVRI